MSVIQSNQEELRYIKRQNLEEESRLYQNYFRDIIHNYGVDCNYYKIKVPYPEKFRRTIDDNNILLHAYGYDSNPKYDVSATIIGYVEVDQDVFNLNKYGMMPNSDVTFTFDRTEFATKFAHRMGQLKEFKIIEKNVDIEIPKTVDDSIIYTDEYGMTHTYNLNQDISPYADSLGIPLTFESDILSGKASFVIGDYEPGKEYDIPAERYQHSDGGYRIPVNKDIYRSYYYDVDVKEYLDALVQLKYRIDDVPVSSDMYGNVCTKRVLHGTIHGSILFRDINAIGKYIELIQPNVGDVVTIDFPNEKSREQYEITECLDKNLGTDGLNPLLHKYVWKCKARRYINGGEDLPERNEANERVQETLDLIQQSDEDIVRKISLYDDVNNDAVYGGYELKPEQVDKQKVDYDKVMEYSPKYMDDGSYDGIHTFGDGSKLVTDGYELYFITSDNRQKTICLTETEGGANLPVIHWTVEDLQYVAATDDELWFKNFDNLAFRLAQTHEISPEERALCMESLLDSTYSTGEINSDGENFYKFKNCRTVLLSLNGDLYCRFSGKHKKLVKLS